MAVRESVPRRRGPGLLAVAVAGLGTIALLATAGLTVPRLLEPRSYPMSVLAAATPLGLVTGLGALAALAGLAAWSRRWPAALAAVLAGGLVAVHLAWLAPAFVGAPTHPTGDGIVVMVQNLEYGSVDDLARVVDEQDVDVLVVVDLGPEQQAAVEASSLPERFADGGPATPTGGTLVLSRFPLGAATDLTPDGRSRLLPVRSSPVGAFLLAAAHPSAPYADGTSTWRADLDAIGSGVAAAGRAADGAVVVLGDLNATRDHRPFRDLLHTADLQDAVDLANAGWTPTFPAHGLHSTRGVRLPPVVAIDHALVGPALTVTSLHRVDVAGTDHLGLVARVARASH